MTVLRVDSQLHFGNVAFLRDRVEAVLERAGNDSPKLKALVLDE